MCVLAVCPCLFTLIPGRSLAGLAHTFLCVCVCFDLYCYVNTCPLECVCQCVSVFVSCLVFHKSSIFMIQLLHKPQIWFSVSLPEQLREGEEEEEGIRRRRKVKVKYRQIEGRRNGENYVKE